MSYDIVMVLANDFASDPRPEKEAMALRQAGYSVAVVAWGREGRLPERETRNGIEIYRVGPTARYGSGPRSLPLFVSFWRRAADEILRHDPAIVHCHDLDTAPAGLSAVRRSMRADVRLVLDLHEMYRESRVIPTNRLLAVLARRVVDTIERRALARADLLVLVSPAFEERYGGFVNRVLVENAPEADRFRPVPTADRGDRFCVCYVGRKRYASSLRDLMEAVQRDSRLAARIAGGGVAEGEIARLAEAYDRVEILGRFTYEEVPGLYRDCQAVFAVYDSAIGNIRYAIPVKALEGMAAGLPVLANRGTWFGDFVLEHGVGLVVDDGDVDELADAIRRLADDPGACAEMGARGRRIVESELNWDAAAGRLVDAYARLRTGA